MTFLFGFMNSGLACIITTIKMPIVDPPLGPPGRAFPERLPVPAAVPPDPQESL